MKSYGIPEDHLFFLGYADGWNVAVNPTSGEKISHLYHAPDGLCMTSHAGMKETYGHSKHPCFRAHQPYRKSAFLQDLKDLLLYVKADAILCVDYDSHPEHRALSLSFDRVMGEILRALPEYRPVVLKSFAYKTAWYSPIVVDKMNILSTTMPYPSGIMEQTNCYDWCSRIRFPVHGSCLTRSVYDNLVYKSLICNRSQFRVFSPVYTAAKIIKGDKVAWWRPTNNILLTAEAYSDVGTPEALHDFMLFDSDDIINPQNKPFRHGWFVEPEKKNEVVFRFRHPEIVREIWLYDHPSQDNQIQEVTIELSNGKILTANQLPEYGAPLCVRTDTEEALDGFTLRVNSFRGADAGLVEVEAYAQHPEYQGNIVKLMDVEGHFMYDYISPLNGKVNFSVYSPRSEAIDQTDIRVTGASCGDISLSQQGVNAFCLEVPYGESCVLETIDRKTQQVVDAVRVSNADMLTRVFLNWRNWAESHIVYLHQKWYQFVLAKFV